MDGRVKPGHDETATSMTTSQETSISFRTTC
jgi:hypothetical protein